MRPAVTHDWFIADRFRTSGSGIQWMVSSNILASSQQVRRHALGTSFVFLLSEVLKTLSELDPKASQSKAVTLKVEKCLTDTTVDLRSLLVREHI